MAWYVVSIIIWRQAIAATLGGMVMIGISTSGGSGGDQRRWQSDRASGSAGASAINLLNIASAREADGQSGTAWQYR